MFICKSHTEAPSITPPENWLYIRGGALLPLLCFSNALTNYEIQFIQLIFIYGTQTYSEGA